MMYSRLQILVVALVLLATGGHTTTADANPLVIWDQRIASAIDAALVDQGCREHVYYSYRLTCVDNELNMNPDRSPFDHLTVLDRVALFVYKYKDLNLNAKIRKNIKLKFTAYLSDIYQKREARARVTLRIRF